MKIGFIGLGSMGAPIARRLARSGFAVTGCDVVPAALSAFDEPGAAREADPIATAAAADVLGVCVRTDAQLEDLVGDGALFAALAVGNLFILNSTVAPDLARRLAVQAAGYGVDFIDVGVSGGAALALDGRLSLFVGGEAAVVERARPFLDAIGTVAWLGPVGRGLEGKLINNILSIANMGLSALAIELGEQLDFDRAQLRTALMIGSAQSFAMNVIPGVLDWPGGHDRGYFESLHALLEKDVRHAADIVPDGSRPLLALQAAARAMLDCVDRAGQAR